MKLTLGLSLTRGRRHFHEPNKRENGERMGGICISALAVFLLLIAACSSNSVEPKPEPNYVASEVLISLAPGTTRAEAEHVLNEVGLQWKKYFENLGVALVGVPPGEERYWIEELESHPLIASAQLNHNNIVLR